jgi:hypothetical protein
MKITNYKERFLTPNPIFPQSLCPLLQPWANKEQLCVCLVGIMPCPAHIAKFSVHESCHQSQTLYQIASLGLK